MVLKNDVAAGQPVRWSDVSFDAFRLVEVTLTGYSTEDLDGPAGAACSRRGSGWNCQPSAICNC